MKADRTTKFYRRLGVKEDHHNVNKYVKAVVVNFYDDRGDIIVTNDNYGSRRKYADFTEGKRKAGLHPFTVVFSGVDVASALKDRFIGPDDKVYTFGDYEEETKC